MGEHRFHLKAEFSIYGQTYRCDMSRNWDEGSSGIDDRILEFIRSSYEDAREKDMEAEIAEQHARELVETERRERAELARLQAKYPQR